MACLALALLVLPLLACGQRKDEKMTREPAVAGQFYPMDRAGLSRMLDQMLAATPAPECGSLPLGVIVPHAGYVYSGPTAARAFRALQGSGAKTVIMLGPAHRVPFRGFALYGHGVWNTPLGPVEIDESLARELAQKCPLVHDLPQAHRLEHSLEVQVPFLQKVLTGFRIVPLMLLEASYSDLQTLARALAEVSRNRNVLILASSDLYHGESYADCRRTDSLTLSHVVRLAPQNLYRDLSTGTAQACGGLPITALMLAMSELGATDVRLLGRTNSNDVTGEKGGYCVGYAAFGFYPARTRQETATGGVSGLLDETEQRELLVLARATIESHLRNGSTPALKARTGRLAEPRGAFVTLHEQGQLRGCIGYIEGIKPLHETIRDMAIAASTEDPRFPPVTEPELKRIDIEITVLTPLERCTDPRHEVIAGAHGIVVKRGSRQGVFLPQVATEAGWDTETLLSQCCAGKAGLPADAWKDKTTEVYRFSGQVFGERQLKGGTR
jgi:hypothetical protein